MFFDYELPDRLIAQAPAARRDDSRLLILHRETDSLEHVHFRDLPQFLNSGDLLVLNNTKVIPARLLGIREATGGKWEGLFLNVQPDGTWELLSQTRGYPHEGEFFAVGASSHPLPVGEGVVDPDAIGRSGGWGFNREPLRLQLVGRTPERHWLMKPDRPGTALELLAAHGQIPLPPYIRKGRAVSEDKDRYQTVYAEVEGSVAAPTAGLHFTPELLEELKNKGLRTAYVTLNVGLGTFAPVKEDDPTKHRIHSEWCEVPPETVAAIRDTKAGQGRVIAVGTTTTRTLETAARGGSLAEFRGESDLFIHPPYDFHVIDGLITNFHLPRTTLLLLVQALSGSELLKRAYVEAVSREYRFFSYGDAMLIL